MRALPWLTVSMLLFSQSVAFAAPRSASNSREVASTSASRPGEVTTTDARVTEASSKPSRTAGSEEDVQRYSAREAASPGAKNFKGGNATVVIGASTATIILAVVLLIVLL